MQRPLFAEKMSLRKIDELLKSACAPKCFSLSDGGHNCARFGQRH